MDFINYIIAEWEAIFAIITSVLGVCAAIAAITPNESDNKIVDILYKIINALGCNFGNAQNAERVDKKIPKVNADKK